MRERKTTQHRNKKLLTVLVVKGERGEERGARAGGVADRAANVAPLLKELGAGTAVVAHKGDVAGDHDVVGLLFFIVGMGQAFRAKMGKNIGQTHVHDRFKV